MSDGQVRSVTFIERDDPFRLHKAMYKPLEQMSKNAWVSLSTGRHRWLRPSLLIDQVACGRDKYILELLGELSFCLSIHASF